MRQSHGVEAEGINVVTLKQRDDTAGVQGRRRGARWHRRPTL